MRINGKKIKNNERMTMSQIEYINARISTLVNQLEERGYEVSHDKSRHSEANYIIINEQTVSFRNHDYFSGMPVAEHTVWLSRFNTWTDAKGHFYTKILPLINGEKVEKEVKQEIKPDYENLIKEAINQLENNTDPNMELALKGRIKHLKEMASLTD